MAKIHTYIDRVDN